MDVSTCVWLNGTHVRPGPYCPHSPETNELGDSDIRPGWTTQQADQEGPSRG